jgi:hypothetical protein
MWVGVSMVRPSEGMLAGIGLQARLDLGEPLDESGGGHDRVPGFVRHGAV